MTTETMASADVESSTEKLVFEEVAVLISEEKQKALKKTKARRFSLVGIARPLFKTKKGQQAPVTTRSVHASEPAKPLKSACKSVETATNAAQREAHVTRKVSFSPSTEDESDMKERNHHPRKAEGGKKTTATDYGHVQHGGRKMRRRASFNDSIGRSGQLHTHVRTSSLCWDKHGVHIKSTAKDTHEGSGDSLTIDVGRPAKARVSKHTIVAAHHARALEQIINAGASLEFGSLDDLKAKREKKTGGKYDRSKVQMIPPVSPRKVLALKKALLDSEKAIDIIAELKKLEIQHELQQEGAAESLRQVQQNEETKQKRALTSRPVRAICLDCTEEEAERRQDQRAAAEATAPAVTESKPTPADSYYSSYWPFSSRSSSQTQMPDQEPKAPTAIDATAVLPALPGVLRDVAPISLITNPASTAAALGAAETGAFDALATLSGAAVHLANGEAGQADGIYPPLDRMAVLIRWWGFEMTLPEPSMRYLSTARSVSGSFLTFLQTMVVTGGVPELLPFVRYFSSFVDMEFAAIKSQDKGHGVVLAATWLMPMALVPRPWDFPTPTGGHSLASLTASPLSASQQDISSRAPLSRTLQSSSSDEDLVSRSETPRQINYQMHVLTSLEEVNETRTSS